MEFDETGAGNLGRLTFMNLHEMPILLSDPEVRGSLVRQLEVEVNTDVRVAALEANSSRVHSLRREQLASMVKIAGENAWPEALSSVVKADTYNATGALYAYRGDPVPLLVAIIERAAPPGTSQNYRSKRVEALRSIVDRGLVASDHTAAVNAAVVRLLDAPDDVPVIKEALRLAQSLDDATVSDKLRVTVELIERGPRDDLRVPARELKIAGPAREPSTTLRH